MKKPRKQAAVVLAHLALIGAGVIVAEGSLLGERPRPPGGAASVFPDAQPEYFRPGRVDRQAVVPPGLVERILLPTLGCPARLEPGKSFPVVLREALAEDEELCLVPREALGELDELLYALPPMPGGAEALRRRLAAARADERPLRSGPGALPPAERRLFRDLRNDASYAERLDALHARVVRETTAEVRERVRRVRHRVEALTASGSAPALPCAVVSARAAGELWRLELRPPPELSAGLYVLVLRDRRGSLADLQLNAVYLPARPTASSFEFLVAGDLQWGERREVVAPCLRWVSLLNAYLAETPPAARPELAMIVGDVVDCTLSSATTRLKQLYGGAQAYPREYLQVWLALAALRLPVHIVPGNHDGYRFEGGGGSTFVDGLLLFESSFGPQYFAFSRPPYRFLCLNGYDLPADYRTGRRSPASSWIESVSEKLNVLNWGGGMRETQFAWLQAQLAPAALGELTPLVFIHHDPRGTYPSPAPEAPSLDSAWSLHRHFPITADPGGRDALEVRVAPPADAMHEVHAGFFTPLRHPSTRVRTDDWFGFNLAELSPSAVGFPGWLRYQHTWHSDHAYTGELRDGSPLGPAGGGLIAPDRLLEVLVRARVPALFKAHDNRFCRARMEAGESIFGARAARSLAVYGEGKRGRGVLARTTLRAPLEVYHVADVSDSTSEGHGFYWVDVAPEGLRVHEIGHF